MGSNKIWKQVGMQRRGEFQGWLQGSSLWKWKRDDYTDTNRDVGRKNEFLGKTMTLIGFFFFFFCGCSLSWFRCRTKNWLVLGSPLNHCAGFEFSPFLWFFPTWTLTTTVEARNPGGFWNERWNEIHIVCSWLGTHSALFILLFLESIQNGLAWLSTENVH